MNTRFADSQKIKQLQKELNIIYDIFELDKNQSSFSSDETTLAMILCSYQSHESLNRSYIKWLLDTIKFRSGVVLAEQELNCPFVELASKFSNVQVSHQKKPWLGITKVTSETDEISINYISLIVENYLYQKGMFLQDSSLYGYKQHLENEKEIFANNKIFFYFENTVKQVSSYFDAYCLCVFLANRSLDTSKE